MARHVHQFYRQETQAKSKYMWKCTSCGWFVHAGLEYVMIGMSAECWNCGDIFQIDQSSLMSGKPMCYDCSGARAAVEAVEEKVKEATTPKEETEEEKKIRETRERLMKEILG